MKYPQVVSMPSAVQSWLEEQLEARGIDAAIYSRYILSLLHHDQPDILDLPNKQKEVSKRGYGRKRGRRENEWDSEQLKRSAAIECLMSASDQNCGIEALVDELCLKLKETRSEGELKAEIKNSVESEQVLDSSFPTSNQELALRYYAAFPPLNIKSTLDIESSRLWNLNRVSAWNGKRVLGSCFGKNRTYSEGNSKEIKLSSEYNWLEENKENQSHKKDMFGKERTRSRSMVKQHISEKVRRNMAKSLDRKDDDSFRFMRMKVDVGKSRRLYQLPSDFTIDPNFSKLVSCSIKALWTPEKAPEDLSGCDKDLPMDFQQLLESPESTKANLNCSKNIGKQQSSFIQCGTNITSSIWSEKLNETSMDCSVGSEGISDLNTGLPVTLGGGSVWSNSGTPSTKLSRQETEDKQLSNQGWSNGETCFTTAHWKLNTNFGDVIQQFGKSEQCSDIESTSLLLDDGSKFYSSLGSNVSNSLNTLNHNKEDSSFTEVIPKSMSSDTKIKRENCTDTDVMEMLEKFGQWSNDENTSLVKQMLDLWPEVDCTNDTSKSQVDIPEVKKEEEDLLTSMKTHFRPIKQESVGIPIPSTTAPSFPDGTTFPISNSLDHPTFERSASGALYLDSDYANKYMEYNDADDDTPSEFVPKFRVRQNEKFCQTDDLSKVVGTMPFSNKVPVDNIDSEFYFPGDESLVREIVEEESDDDLEDNGIMTEWSETRIKVGGWVAAWPTNSGIWSNNAANAQQSWFNIWSEGEENLGGGDHYVRLRDELTEDAEELFSDLSSIQNLYLASDCMDSNDGPQVQTSKPLECLIQNTNSILFCVESEQKTNERLLKLKTRKERKRRYWSSHSQQVCSGNSSSQQLLSTIPCPTRPLTL